MPIPEDFDPVLDRLLALTREQLATLFAHLADSDLTISTRDLAAPIERATGLTATDARELAAFLLTLHIQRQRQTDWGSVPIGRFLSAFRESVEAKGKNPINFTWADLTGTLEQFLEGRSKVAASARASDLLYEQERLLHSARIVTDVRPVFGASNPEELKAAMPMHSLRLDYFDTGSGESRSLHVALDRSDLEKLSRVIERAQRKHDSLLEAWRRTGIPWLEPPRAGEDE